MHICPSWTRDPSSVPPEVPVLPFFCECTDCNDAPFVIFGLRNQISFDFSIIRKALLFDQHATDRASEEFGEERGSHGFLVTEW